MEQLTRLIIPLPDTPRDIKIKSFSNPSTIYTLNLSKMTCTCQDYIKRHAKHKKGSMERACKHLKLELSKEPSLQGTVFALILSDSHHTTAYRVSKETESIIGYSEDTINEWINVYAKDTTSKYDKFGYSVDEQRWSSNKMPIKADAIETLIKEVIAPIIEGEEQEEDDESAVELNSDELENAMREFGVTLDSIIEEGIIYEMEIFALKMVMSPIRKYLIVPPFNELVIAMSKILENENYTKKDEREKLVSVIKDVRKKTK